MRLLSVFFTLILATSTFATPSIREGEIEGAKFFILSPTEPNGKVLLLAHGYHPEDAPLSAGFNPESPLATALVEEGWIIAATSYRRNGWSIDDALTDLGLLHAEVTKTHGPPSRTFILGNVMGGQLATLAAEGQLTVDGAVSVNLLLKETPKKKINPKLTYAPKVPLILLRNTHTKRSASTHYAKKAGNELTSLWRVQRPGSSNVSDLEKLAAIRGLEGWLEGKERPRKKNATLPTPQHPSSATASLMGKVTYVDEAWGNLTTSFVASDLAVLSVKSQDQLIAKAESGEQSATLTVTDHYSLLPQGEGAAFLSPDGYLILQINGENLAEQLDISIFEKVVLSKK